MCIDEFILFMKIIYNVKAMEGGFLVKEGIRREYKKQYDASTKTFSPYDEVKVS